MRTTSSVQFYCRESKSDKKGMSPIEASITLNCSRVFMSLPVKVRPGEFNVRKRPRHIERYLDEWRVKFVEMQSELMANGIPVTAENLKKMVRSGGVISCKLSDVSREFLNDLKHRAECPVYRKYELVFQRLIEDLGDVEVNTVTNGQLIRHYELMKKAYKPQTSASMFQKVRSLFKFAVSEGKIRTNPCEGIKVSRGKMEISYLTMEEIDYIYHAELQNESIERTRDVFVFMCCSGLAYADVSRLRPEDMRIDEDGTHYIMKTRQKTGVTYTSVVLPFGVEIWEKYHGVLPVLSNQKINLNLKMFESLIGLKKHISCHVGRHSFAMLLLNSGVRLETVAAALGHSNTQVTQQHYARLTTNTVVREITGIMK